MTDQSRALTGSLRTNLLRYIPALAVLAALAVWVAAAPSTTPRSDVASVDIFGSDDGSSFGSPGGENDDTGSDDATGTTSSGQRSAGNAGSTSRAGGSTSGTGGGDGGAGGGEPVPGTEDCSRAEVASTMGCRPPASGFTSANNGGATMRGVTAETINVVAYQVRQNEQVAAILSAAGSANDANRKASFEAIIAWMNQNVELHGRKLNPIYYVGTTPANDAAGQQADAVHVAEELDAAFVLTLYAAPIFSEELHRRGVPHFTWNQFPRSFHDALAPHLFGLFPDRDQTMDHQAEYWCKRLAGSPAIHAEDPTYRASDRKFGIIYQEATDNGPYLQKLVKQKCGTEVTKVLGYPADIGNAVAIATNAVTQMREAGVTTVACLCDVIAPIFFTQQATNQAWFPEWIHNGFFVTDANGAGRLYDRAQWSNSFGPSSLSFPSPIAENNGYRVCRAGGGGHEDCVAGQASYWAFAAYLGLALERMGPNINAADFARALVSIPPTGGTTPNEPLFSFGTGGGGGPYTLIDDFMEIWWDPTREGNDGKNGTAFYVQSGRRYLQGGWPAGAPNVFVDDGSAQPERDPDL